MKLYTSLALSLIAALSGFAALELKAMDVPQIPTGQAPRGGQQAPEESKVWIGNNSNWTLEVTYQKSVSAGGDVGKIRLGSGDVFALGAAKTLAKVDYKTYGEIYGKLAPVYSLDFKKDLRAGNDIAFILSAGGAPTEAPTPSPATSPESSEGSMSSVIQSISESRIGSYISSLSRPTAFSKWEVEVRYLKPGEIPTLEVATQERLTETSELMPPTSPWSAFNPAIQKAQLDVEAQQNKVYRLMLKLGTNYTLGDLKTALAGVSSQHPNRQDVQQLLQAAYAALEKDLQRREK